MPTESSSDTANESVEEFRDVVEDADVVIVGEDHEYRPSSPRLREQMGVDE